MASSTLQEMLGSPPQNNNNSNKWKGEWGPAGIGYGSSEDSEQNKTKPNITLQNKTNKLNRTGPTGIWEGWRLVQRNSEVKRNEDR